MNWTIEAPSCVEKISYPNSFYLTEFSTFAIKSLQIKINEAIDNSQGVFPIHIESFGGDISALKAILSILSAAKRKGIKIATITAGHACSAGAFVFCFGDDNFRFMGDHAQLMIHGIQVHGQLEGRASEQNQFFNELIKDEQELLQIISSHLKGARNKDWLKKELHKRKDIDWYISAKEALDLGLCNHIGLPTFSLKLTTEISVDI